jgi:hypothetical protein
MNVFPQRASTSVQTRSAGVSILNRESYNTPLGICLGTGCSRWSPGYWRSICIIFLIGLASFSQNTAECQVHRRNISCIPPTALHRHPVPAALSPSESFDGGSMLQGIPPTCARMEPPKGLWPTSCSQHGSLNACESHVWRHCAGVL